MKKTLQHAILTKENKERKVRCRTSTLIEFAGDLHPDLVEMLLPYNGTKFGFHACSVLASPRHRLKIKPNHGESLTSCFMRRIIIHKGLPWHHQAQFPQQQPRLDTNQITEEERHHQNWQQFQEPRVKKPKSNLSSAINLSVINPYTPFSFCF